MKRIMLVDLMGCMMMYHNNKDFSFAQSFIATLRDIVDKYSIDRTLLLCEGGSEYRKELLPTYKGARAIRKSKYTEAEKKEYDKFLKEINTLTHDLGLLGITRVRLAGWEADDCAGALCAMAPSEQYALCLLSEDSDWNQLLSRSRTVQGSYKKMIKEGMTKESWKSYNKLTSEKGYTPCQMFEMKLCTGDSSDSIPGLSGVGGGTMEKLMEKYSNLETILKCKTELDVPRMTSKAKESFLDCEQLLARNYSLMNLRWCKEEWQNKLGDAKYRYLSEIIDSWEQPVEVSEYDFQELCFEKGWVKFTESDWIRTFY